METHINSWGNSLAVRIPKALAANLGLKENSPIDISINDGVLFIKPIEPSKKPRRYTLEELLAKIPEGYDPAKDPEIQEWLNIKSVGKETIKDDWS